MLQGIYFILVESSARFRGVRGPEAPTKWGLHHVYEFSHMCSMCVPLRYFYRGKSFVDAMDSSSLEYYLILWRNNYYTQWCRRRGCRWCKRTPKSFDLVETRLKSLKIRAKSVKTFANSLQLRAKMAPNVCDLKEIAPNVLSFEKMAPKITRRRFFLEVIRNAVFMHKKIIFRASLRKFGQKSFAPPKICLLLHLWLHLLFAESRSTVRYVNLVNARPSRAERISLRLYSFLVDFASAQVANE